ncbi:MAG: ferrous iron transport protein A [Methanomicrobiales archaeon]|jgi:ferrous iron transport protein A|nr:ferrous iron transport protein A [Methanomicrobiales archaeon]
MQSDTSLDLPLKQSSKLITTLDAVLIGQAGIVTSLHHDSSFTHRLLELGITKGTAISVCGASPLGDPIMITARGCQFAIRRADAKKIGVERS